MKGGANIQDAQQDPANLEAEELSTNQEAAVIPMFAGEAKFALVWLSPAMNQFTREAPAERPGKK
ncbi:MAG: hypothetical protein J0L84_16890 [Verrucomicrobia bacterium]|nr:hypothetical protein [Verrucomicrobiota bacterium]